VNAIDHELIQRLGTIREQGLYRELRRIDSPQTVLSETTLATRIENCVLREHFSAGEKWNVNVKT